MNEFLVFGGITQDLHNLFCRYSDNNWIHINSISPAMHEINIFPSISQVSEVVQIASTICHSNLECPPDSLTFGEFCLFVSSLQEQYKNGIQKCPIARIQNSKNVQQKRSKTCQISNKYEIFLGGSCNPTTWRKDIVIPILKKFGITYYNPQVSCWSSEMILLEDQAKDKAEVLLFVIDSQTRSIASVGEAAYLAGRQRKLILVIKCINNPYSVIMGENISARELEDLKVGYEFLHDLAERQGYPVFTDIETAAHCAVKVVQQGIQVQDLTPEDGAHPVKMAHAWTGDRLVNVRNAFNSVDSNKSGFITWNDVCLAFKSITHTELQSSWLRDKIPNLMNHPFSFEEFCCLVTEFKNQQTVYKQTLSYLLTPFSGIWKIFDYFISPLTYLFSLFFPNLLKKSESYTFDCLTQRDVFLGGSCDGESWREEIAIPLLRKHGLTYFNPVMPNWSARFIPLEAAFIENSRLLLFVITGQSRAIAAMALASYYIGLGSNIVLFIQNLKSNAIIAGEKVSAQGLKDYNRGRLFLSDIANREGIPIFDNISEAVMCAINRLKTD